MILRQSAALIGLSAALVACQTQDTSRVSAAEITEVNTADLPDSVTTAIAAAQSDFKVSEVLKKVRDGRVYYDVEGELPSGEEIEFDVLMTSRGAEIVEIQKDIDWSDVPQAARNAVGDANVDGLEIVRVIESTQTDMAVIYEVFAAGYPSDPKFEVWTKDDQIKLLPTRWRH